MKQMQEEINIAEDTQKDKFLTFMLENEVYAIEIRYVTEIIGIQPITSVPELPEYVKGIINLRGKIIPVMDIRLKFQKEPAVYNDRTCIIVVEVQDISLGLIVDNVSEVMSIAKENIVSPPDMNRKAESKHLKGIGKVGNDVKLILECEKLMIDYDISETQSQME